MRLVQVWNLNEVDNRHKESDELHQVVNLISVKF